MVRCDAGYSTDIFYVKQMSHLLPIFYPVFTPFGSAVRGKGTPKIASIGHSLLGSTKVRYDTGFSNALFIQIYVNFVTPPPLLLPLLAFWTGVKPHLRFWHWYQSELGEV